MKFCHYICPASVAEAAEWAEKPGTVILGGMMWLRMQKRTVENAVDLSKLDLNKIEETENGIRIGAYVTLRELETSPLLMQYTHGAVKEAFSPIVGVQFRNTATLGGSIFGRFGFSDVSTLFTALGASVCLAKAGGVPIGEFVKNGAPRDLLTHITLPRKAPDSVAVAALRNSATDFPVMTTAVCRRGETVRVTLSPAPIRGQTVDYAVSEMTEIPSKFISAVSFRSDNTASAAYREHLARVLIRRSVTAIGG